jgi:acetoin utilization deacetylase AcuC-like enzyme
MNTGYYTDPIFLRHDTGDHPEHASRLRAISQAVQAAGLPSRLRLHGAEPATEEDLKLIHSVEYIRRVEEAALSGQAYLGTPDCLLSEDTFSVAKHAAGTLKHAVTEVAEGRLDNAFVACRPPGHHAEQSQALGFCFFNNVAIGAEFLVRELGYERVLIFDFDVHHGNGTQHAFESRKDVFYASMHQHPRTCYPGTGYLEEKGTGDGLGYTLNMPMLPYATDDDYLRILESQVLPAFRDYRPQFILLSAGFDGHQDDPLALVNLTQHGFDTILRRMQQLAHEMCGGKLVSVLEGGYHLQRLSECVTSHLQILHTSPE